MISVFGNCELDEQLYELRRAGVPIKLDPKAFKVLAYLIQHRDRVVTKDELFEKLWTGAFVTESALTRCIVKARQAVHDDGVAQRVIKTVHRHGYRFVAAIETRIHGAATDISPAVHPTAHQAAELPSSTPKDKANKTLTGRHTCEGERKQVTVLSAGVQGITALAQAFDPEALHDILNRLFDLMRAEIQRLEGIVSQLTGDGLTALFGVPIAHEDQAVRALHAALGIQQAFATFANDLRRTDGVTLALRLGVHSGPVLVGAIGNDGHPDYTAHGFATYLACSGPQTRAQGRLFAGRYT